MSCPDCGQTMPESGACPRCGPAAPPPAAPVPLGERIGLWDALRGLAVLGVLLANMPLMAFSEALSWDAAALGPDPDGLDRFAFGLVRILADTKFITIFSLLFGAGLGLMSEKALAAGDRPFAGLYLRRLALLAVFGLIHGLLIWWGDILFHYALIGAVALLFRRLSGASLALGGLALLGVGFALNLLFGMMDPAEMSEGGEDPAEQAAIWSRVFSSGEFGPMVRERVEIWGLGFFVMTLFWGWRTLGLFLLGMALVKSGILVEPERHRRLFVRVAVMGLAVGLPLSVLDWWTAFEVSLLHGEGATAGTGMRLTHAATTYLMALFQSPAYVALVALWAAAGGSRRLFDRLAAVGRMALTNYLSHSLITAVVFNYLGFYDRWGRFEGLVFTVGIFVFQLWASPLWLARFRFGPLEWIWRSATYGRLQPLRVARPSP